MNIRNVLFAAIAAAACLAPAHSAPARKVEEIKGEELEAVKTFAASKGLLPVSNIYKLTPGLKLTPPGAITMRYARGKLAALRVREETLYIYAITPAEGLMGKLGNQVANRGKGELNAEIYITPQFVGILGAAEPEPVRLKKDVTPPRTFAPFTIPGYKEHYSASAKIYLDPHDPPVEGRETSGPDKTWYSVDSPAGAMGGNLYTGPFQLGEGKHTLYFRSSDKAGNFEVLNSSVVWIDGTPPVTTVSVLGRGRVEGGTAYVAAGSSIALSAQDPESGGVKSEIGMIMFNPSGKDCSELKKSYWAKAPGVCAGFIYTGPFALPPGSYTLYYTSMDWTGNSEKLKKMAVKVGP